MSLKSWFFICDRYKIIFLLLQSSPVQKAEMSGANIEDIKEQELTDNTLKNQVDVDSSVDDLTGLDNNEENPMPSPQQEV
jgi:hypothetical protein